MHNSKLKHLFIFLSSISCIFVYASLLFLFAYSIHQDISYKEQITNLSLNEISSSINTAIKSIESKTLSCTQSVDFLYFSNRTDEKQVTSLADTIGDLEKSTFFSSSEVVAFFLYNSACNVNYSYVRSYDYSDMKMKMQQMLEALPNDNAPSYSYSTFEQNNQFYITYSITKRYGTITVVISPADNRTMNSHNTSSLYEKGIIEFSLSDNAGTDTLKCSAKLDSVDLYLKHEATREVALSNSQAIMLLMIIIVYLFIPLAFLAIYRLIISPLNILSQDMSIISDGNLDHRLSASYYLDDINKLTIEINDMLDRIEEHKTAEFDSRMDAMQAKLQFLQLQIRPHFLLNCLKNLISLLNLQKYSEAKDLSFYLSDYISYNFSDTRNFVSLKNELNYVQNYVNLCSLLSYEIKLSYNIDGRSISAECLPLSILSFVENSIKHTQNITSLCINITTEIMNESKSAEMIKILIRDNGGGFPDEYLDEFNKIDPSKLIYRKNKIGINNTYYRLWLIYGKKASLRAYNEDSWAVIEIIQPYAHVVERSTS